MATKKKYGFVIDISRCIGCHACTVACKEQWKVPVGHSRNWVLDMGIRGSYPNLSQVFITGQCMHCDDPPCVEACPSGATYKREDGLVVIDEGTCIGCGYCIPACPYDARFYNEEKGVADKCNGCFNRVEEGELPACVATCVGGARMFGDFNDPNSLVSRMVRENSTVRLVTDETNPGPNVYYIGLSQDLQQEVLPHESRLPTAGQVWKALIIPFVKLAVGVTFLGQAIAFGAQLVKGESVDE
ncbi:MAG TPA: 4Fe-4S dicluster domain-containing protein [Anaerolineae bacterium]|nr:4Fe-4S dicluster domain-containing protein [Anaerolineae bacterium]